MKDLIGMLRMLIDDMPIVTAILSSGHDYEYYVYIYVQVNRLGA